MERAAQPLPDPSPVRGNVHQAGEGGGVTLFDQQMESNTLLEPRVVALMLSDGPKGAAWPAMAPVFGILQFDVTNDVAFTEGTHVVVIPGSAHWRATVAPEPPLGLLLFTAGGVSVRRLLRSQRLQPADRRVRRTRNVCSSTLDS
jgi:hypothetical protein